MLNSRPVRPIFVGLTLVLALAGCSTPDERGVPEEVIRHNILGTAYLGQTKWVDAEQAFRKALELRPSDPLLLTNTAIALIQQNEIEAAVELLEQAVALDSDYAPAHFNLGLVETRQGEFERASGRFETVARLDSEDLFTQYYLGTSLSRIGREEEAVSAFRAALARDPTHVSSLYALGRLLLQHGEQEEGMQLITRSQEIRARSGLDEAVGADYGEQGGYSRAADYPGGALAAPSPVPVGFAGVARVTLESGPNGLPWALTRIDGVDRPVLVTGLRRSVLQLSPPGRSAPLAEIGEEGSSIVSLAAGDADNDERVDLVALVLKQDGPGKTSFAPALMMQEAGGSFATAQAGAFEGDVEIAVGDGGTRMDVTFVDRDHDGDVDLFWCWAGTSGAGCKLGTNDGAGRFAVRDSGEHGFTFEAGAAGPVTVAFSDADNDRDLDLLAAGPGGIRLYSNQRDGTFEEISTDVGLGGALAGTGALAIADMNKDGWMDLVVGREGGPHLLLNRRGRFETATPLTGGVTGGSSSVTLLDFDNDGFIDLFASSGGGPLVLHNRGAGEWLRADDLLESAGVAPDTSVLAGFDMDGDGDCDLATFDAQGTFALLSNEGGNANRWIVLDTRGVGDNKFGIGAKAEVLAGALRQKFEVTSPLPLHVGLGARDRVQSARYLWPSGVLQDEIDLETGGEVEIAQLDRKGTSCPLLYAWREDGWEFVTDFLGGCAIGYQHAPGVFSIPDTDEYVRIEGGLQPDEAGNLRVRLNNQLEEVIWFDRAELIVVDHPVDTEVYPNERLMPGPPFPEFRLFASDDIRPILSAHSVEDGSDLTELLRENDRRYVDNFELLPPKGYAELHTVELDLGEFPAGRRIVLLLDGWIDYADSTSNLAAHQAGLPLIPPRLFVVGEEGGWIETKGVMGFPAGLPKTMAVDLSGLFATPDHRLRIETTMRIYWDRARVMVGGEKTPVHVTRLSASRAELGFGGFPAETSPNGLRPFGYDPDDVSPGYPWKAHVGRYTSFGDVTSLLGAMDDRFVTTRNGDEIELTFSSPAPPADGFRRTYLLYADGFGKDMDPNSAANNEIGPIPFHGMPVYPYPEDVSPPVGPEEDGRAPRRVVESPEGWPGAPPMWRHLLEDD